MNYISVKKTKRPQTSWGASRDRAELGATLPRAPPEVLAISGLQMGSQGSQRGGVEDNGKAEALPLSSPEQNLSREREGCASGCTGFYQGQMRPDSTYVRYPGVQFLETESRVAAARGRGSGTCGVV